MSKMLLAFPNHFIGTSHLVSHAIWKSCLFFMSQKWSLRKRRAWSRLALGSQSRGEWKARPPLSLVTCTRLQSALPIAHFGRVYLLLLCRLVVLFSLKRIESPTHLRPLKSPGLFLCLGEPWVYHLLEAVLGTLWITHDSTDHVFYSNVK